MESFTDMSGHEIPLSQIKDIVPGIDTKCQRTGPRMPDPKAPCHFTVMLADGTTRDSKEYADRQSAAAARHELQVALRERRD
jgi:hypothetical protein